VVRLSREIRGEAREGRGVAGGPRL
jgi:hypothetical protein